MLGVTVWYNAKQRNPTQHNTYDMIWLCNCLGMIYNHGWIYMWFWNETNQEISHDRGLVVWKASHRFHFGFIFAFSITMNFRLIYHFVYNLIYSYSHVRSPGVWRRCLDRLDGLVQDCSNSSALAMELLQSCTKSSDCSHWIIGAAVLPNNLNTSVNLSWFLLCSFNNRYTAT